ncbi:MAG: hypothetical protein J6P60_01205 [Lachnospiraceae bacterium]|nr:hypothetical protein [Lachnospiraceae bacterium]
MNKKPFDSLSHDQTAGKVRCWFLGGLRASSAIEAALIMPLILAILFLLLFLILFLFTRASFVRNAYLCALRASRAETEQMNVRIGIAKREYARLSEATYAEFVTHNTQIRGKGETVTVEIRLRQDFPQAVYLGNGKLPGRSDTKITCRAQSCHPAAFIRLCRRISGRNRREADQSLNIEAR